MAHSRGGMDLWLSLFCRISPMNFCGIELLGVFQRVSHLLYFIRGDTFRLPPLPPFAPRIFPPHLKIYSPLFGFLPSTVPSNLLSPSTLCSSPLPLPHGRLEHLLFVFPVSPGNCAWTPTARLTLLIFSSHLSGFRGT